MNQLHQLYFFKLVLSDHAAGITSVAARLAAKTRRVADVTDRQIGFGQNFATIQIRNGNFGGWDQKEIVFRVHPKHVFCGLGQLASSPGTVRIDHIGDIDFLITVLLGVQVQHKLG